VADADQVRGKLAGKIQARERESEAQIELPSDPVSAAQREERRAETWLPTVLIWTVAIVVGLATGSVSLGLGALVLGHLLLQASAALRRAAS
jgi:cytochrome c biogenesis protein CcdA